MELDFANETIEHLLLKKVLTEKNWLSILTSVYESLFGKSKNKDKKTLFKDRTIGLIAKLAMKYYQKYNQAPDNRVV